MAYYDALIAKWAQAPAGTTASKITWVNSQTLNGHAIPMIVPTYNIYNLIVRSEFDALSAALQQSVRDILSMGTVDGSPGTQIRSRIIQIFPNGTATFTNLNNYAKAFDTPQVPWWGVPVANGGGGLSGPVSQADCDACVPPLV
jgi:hypothetical protein